MPIYDPKKIEKKWQDVWEKEKSFQGQDFSERKKTYLLVEFPYPSGAGLHVGHARSYTAMDVLARKRRMQGENVLYPIGYDSFGLPTENYAIKTGRPPAEITKENVGNFRRQLKSLGFSFDWDREVDTSDPSYYKWTQWIFLKFFERGLAYKAKTLINWCPKDKIGLAHEEVVGGRCERCGTVVEQREKEQWMLKITAYAERLLKDLDQVDYVPRIRTQQENWIGKSEGAEVRFYLKSVPGQPDGKHFVDVFTTRLDTIFGATFIVISPELAKFWVDIGWQAPVEVKKYIAESLGERELERIESAAREKTGVFSGMSAINPATGKDIPVWVADYVLGSYGTGAIMAVPGHDERDYEFAKKFSLPIKRVVEPKFVTTTGEGAVHPNEEFVKRNAICAIIKNPTDGKYLCISWKKNIIMRGLVTGGIEENENIVEAAQREILEETGYRVRLDRDPEFAIQVLFFHRVKKVNRWARFQYLFFVLENDTPSPVAEKEADLHEVVWKSKDELKDFFSVIEGSFILNLIDNPDYIFTDDGVLHESGEFDGLDSQEARLTIAKKIEAKRTTKFKLRDWVFSRQRYWGDPIPMVHCEKDGWVPVPEQELPVILPNVEKYQPTDTGESPLASIVDWVTTTCPKCGGAGKRETDTMPNWAGSSWYFLRYCDPSNNTFFAAADKLKYWMPVDWYNGGLEHTTLHLLYSRFWHKFLFDLGLVPTSEPYAKRTSHGMVLASDGAKMSKSLGNVVNPDDVVATYGADTLRLYEMFMGPFADAISWNTESMAGVRRFLERVWHSTLEPTTTKARPASADEDAEFARSIARVVKKVGDDIEAFRFNTAISAMMEFVNYLYSVKEVTFSRRDEVTQTLLQLLFPFAPHITSELWERRFPEAGKLSEQAWPTFNAADLVSDVATITIQINGKLRGTINATTGASQEEVAPTAKDEPNIAKWLSGKTIKKIIFVPNKLVNFVIE